MNVISFTRRVVKKGRKLEVEFEEAFSKLVEDGTPIPPHLLKPIFESRSAHQCRADDDGPDKKQKRADTANSLIDIVMVIIDAYIRGCINTSFDPSFKI